MGIGLCLPESRDASIFDEDIGAARPPVAAAWKHEGVADQH
jgi:hypothetical protein